MSFVSYAQNFEDVMLWRALKHLEQGFYIDVGAWSPDLDSVTRAFYERGWKGINIEPNPPFHHQLQERRPQDINLRVAVSDHDDVLVMNLLSNPGLSTLDDDIARRHHESGWETDRQEVRVTTLAAICQQHVPPGQAVHFLKVDVEGFEKASLQGNDWTKNRPWIVVVEATLPMSQVESYEAWEPTLLGASYRFAYADGLNRFYVSEEHSELMPAFKYPPNVFDQFVLIGQVQAEARAQQAETRAQQEATRAEQAEGQSQQAEARAQQDAIRADQAEARAQQEATRAEQAEARAQQEAIRADQAESHAQQAEERIQIEGRRVEQAEARAQQADSRAAEAEVRVAAIEATMEATRKELRDVHQANHNHWQLAETRHQQIQALLSSTSWRITAPLRWASTVLRNLLGWIATMPTRLKAVIRRFLSHAASFFRSHPRLRRALHAMINRFPVLKQRLIRSIVGGTTHQAVSENIPHNLMADILDLTPRARRIYTDLKALIENNQRAS